MVEIESYKDCSKHRIDKSTEIRSIKLEDYIDYTNLSSTASKEDIKDLCKTATSRGYKSVCIHGAYVSYVKTNYPELTVCSVASFPLGASSIQVKVLEVAALLSSGADEVDVVLNLSFVKDCNKEAITSEVLAVLNTAHEVLINQRVSEDRKPLVVKFIIEAIMFDKATVEVVSSWIKEAYWDNKHMFGMVKEVYVKTSTGYGVSFARKEDVLVMHLGVGDNSLVGIKAAGGIKSIEKAIEMVNAGATRLGTSTDLMAEYDK